MRTWASGDEAGLAWAAGDGGIDCPPPAFVLPLSTEGFPAHGATFIHRLPKRYVKEFSRKDYAMTLRAETPKWFEVNEV